MNIINIMKLILNIVLIGSGIIIGVTIGRIIASLIISIC